MFIFANFVDASAIFSILEHIWSWNLVFLFFYYFFFFIVSYDIIPRLVRFISHSLLKAKVCDPEGIPFQVYNTRMFERDLGTDPCPYITIPYRVLQIIKPKTVVSCNARVKNTSRRDVSSNESGFEWKKKKKKRGKGEKKKKDRDREREGNINNENLVPG